MTGDAIEDEWRYRKYTRPMARQRLETIHCASPTSRSALQFRNLHTGLGHEKRLDDLAVALSVISPSTSSIVPAVRPSVSRRIRS